jgi:hypothetical protein
MNIETRDNKTRFEKRSKIKKTKIPHPLLQHFQEKRKKKTKTSINKVPGQTRRKKKQAAARKDTR